MDPIQVTVSRGDLVESVHLVDAVVVDREGAILASAGDARRVTYWRSSAKPFQALPTVRKAAQASRPLQDAEISVMCGS
ncbi:MAG TPA: asparaginase, partial [Limnochordia bacterium]|nr:asparaginase [Limnochordia bacterium]